MSTALAESEWISLGPACKLLGVSRGTVRELIEAGRLSVRRIPGAWDKVRSDEVEALAMAYTTPAVRAKEVATC